MTQQCNIQEVDSQTPQQYFDDSNDIQQRTEGSVFCFKIMYCHIYGYQYLQTAVFQGVLYHLKREMKAAFASKQPIGMTIRLD